jgi:hypothetical protein
MLSFIDLCKILLKLISTILNYFLLDLRDAKLSLHLTFFLIKNKNILIILLGCDVIFTFALFSIIFFGIML